MLASTALYNSGVIKPPGPSVGRVGAVAPGSPAERVGGDASRLLVAVAPAPAQGPGFAIGEAVTARLIEPLPNRQWLAVVKGGVFTLHLPAAAANPATAPAWVPAKGETLSLQVASLTPRLSFVLAGASTASPAGSAVAVQLSDAARTLTDLIHAGERGRLPARTAAIETMTVLLGNPTSPPAERAQAVAQAISHSGLFYESHLLAWAEGRLPLSSVADEPQARLAQALKSTDSGRRADASAELGALLQRQLDALDGKPLTFAGFAWPGQAAEWHIQRDAPDTSNPRDDEAADKPPRDTPAQAPAWTTQIDLTLPHLGALGAQVRVTGSQVTLAMALSTDAGARLLAAHRGRLASALQAAGLTLSELTVQAPEAARGPTEAP